MATISPLSSFLPEAPVSNYQELLHDIGPSILAQLAGAIASQQMLALERGVYPPSQVPHYVEACSALRGPAFLEELVCIAGTRATLLAASERMWIALQNTRISPEAQVQLHIAKDVAQNEIDEREAFLDSTFFLELAARYDLTPEHVQALLLAYRSLPQEKREQQAGAYAIAQEVIHRLLREDARRERELVWPCNRMRLDVSHQYPVTPFVQFLLDEAANQGFAPFFADVNYKIGRGDNAPVSTSLQA